MPVAGVDVNEEGNERPVDEVVVVVREKGVADPAGLPKFKLKPDVAGAVFCNPKVNPVVGLAPNMVPVPDVDDVVAEVPKLPKGVAPVLLAAGFVPKENGVAVPVAGLRVVVEEPPNENPVVAIVFLRA